VLDSGIFRGSVHLQQQKRIKDQGGQEQPILFSINRAARDYHYNPRPKSATRAKSESPVGQRAAHNSTTTDNSGPSIFYVTVHDLKTPSGASADVSKTHLTLSLGNESDKERGFTAGVVQTCAGTGAKIPFTRKLDSDNTLCVTILGRHGTQWSYTPDTSDNGMEKRASPSRPASMHSIDLGSQVNGIPTHFPVTVGGEQGWNIILSFSGLRPTKRRVFHTRPPSSLVAVDAGRQMLQESHVSPDLGAAIMHSPALGYKNGDAPMTLEMEYRNNTMRIWVCAPAENPSPGGEGRTTAPTEQSKLTSQHMDKSHSMRARLWGHAYNALTVAAFGREKTIALPGRVQAATGRARFLEARGLLQVLFDVTDATDGGAEVGTGAVHHDRILTIETCVCGREEDCVCLDSFRKMPEVHRGHNHVHDFNAVGNRQVNGREYKSSNRLNGYDDNGSGFNNSYTMPKYNILNSHQHNNGYNGHKHIITPRPIQHSDLRVASDAMGHYPLQDCNAEPLTVGPRPRYSQNEDAPVPIIVPQYPTVRYNSTIRTTPSEKSNAHRYPTYLPVTTYQEAAATSATGRHFPTRVHSSQVASPPHRWGIHSYVSVYYN
jgi:hypothetical protein